MVQPNGLPGCWSDAWNWVCCASGQGGPRAPNRESKGRCRSKLSLKAAAELPLPLPACHFFLCTLQGPPQHLPDIKRLAPPPTHPPTHPLTDTSAAPTTRLLYPDTQTPPAPGQWLVRAAAVLPHQLVPNTPTSPSPLQSFTPAAHSTTCPPKTPPPHLLHASGLSGLLLCFHTSWSHSISLPGSALSLRPRAL